MCSFHCQDASGRKVAQLIMNLWSTGADEAERVFILNALKATPCNTACHQPTSEIGRTHLHSHPVLGSLVLQALRSRGPGAKKTYMPMYMVLENAKLIAISKRKQFTKLTMDMPWTPMPDRNLVRGSAETLAEILASPRADVLHTCCLCWLLNTAY